METTNEIMLSETNEIAPTQSMTSFADVLMQEVTEQGYFATFKVETMADKKKLFHARNDNTMLRDAEGEQIQCIGFVLDTVRINDPEAGMKTVPAAHIIAEDGAVYQSAATGVVKSVCDIISNFGMPDTWDEPLVVVLKETTTRNGFRYKYLDVV